MKLRLVVLSLALALASTAHAAARNVTDPQAPRALPESDSVNVRWEDPSRFSELRYSGNRWEASRGDWVQELAAYIRERADKRLPAGQRLDVDILDIRRAGGFEGWHGPNLQNTRIIRDVYPPRMTLNVRLTDAGGNVIAQGERKLSDPGFLMGDTSSLDTDPLRFEKRLIDRWLSQELKS
ncbi:DUF3016 domain-containing protein [Lysobacter auxotrophicus]|uniref:DUF3016 domain-containing protein n=1 Tax=Lysobacter auxotrophicus TaxID=2992573 RepID=A0ABN6UPD7_9GAMM|nr:DUF3016 domain-containing protein [Lysobacter auxotrophicus]BDU18247.1 DUF3016 domain-containing protein [Lysobacter auxotrophicus]